MRDAASVGPAGRELAVSWGTVTPHGVQVYMRADRRYLRLLVPHRGFPVSAWVVLVCAGCGSQFWFHASSLANRAELTAARYHFGRHWHFGPWGFRL